MWSLEVVETSLNMFLKEVIMAVPRDKIVLVADFCNQITKDTVKFVDEKIPEMTMAELEETFSAIMVSIREQLLGRKKNGQEN
jgi:hypothetical protein